MSFKADSSKKQKINAAPVTAVEAQAIGEKLAITFKIFTPEQLAKGINHENNEHGDFTFGDPFQAAKIARPHLEEDPEYYDKIEKILENQLKQKQNAKQLPKRYFARAMESGVCQYEDEMVMLTNDCLKRMMPSAEGNPVYVDHVAEVDVRNLQNDADGFVVKQFYNEVDGHIWTEFLAVSDDAHDKIQKGWKVSTAYKPTKSGNSGTLHNVKYDREILDGFYTHLAIVNNPRYENAIILSPEDFKDYNEKKTQELKELKNSKEKKGGKLMFKIFKKQEIKDSVDLKDAEIQLENGKTINLAELINAVEKEEKEKEGKSSYDSDTEVEVGGKKMKLGSLVEKYNKIMKKNAEDEESEEAKDKKKAEKEAKENESDEETKKEKEKKEKEEKDKQNALAVAEAKAVEAKKNFDTLLNAKDGDADIEVRIYTESDQVKRGQELYGSK